jgi:hypothetical protein
VSVIVSMKSISCSEVEEEEKEGKKNQTFCGAHDDFGVGKV